jgi:hypothetical protein
VVFKRIFLPESSDRKSEQAKASQTAVMAVENERDYYALPAHTRQMFKYPEEAC